jgi:hypothetical protein
VPQGKRLHAINFRDDRRTADQSRLECRHLSHLRRTEGTQSSGEAGLVSRIAGGTPMASRPGEASPLRSTLKFERLVIVIRRLTTTAIFVVCLGLTLNFAGWNLVFTGRRIFGAAAVICGVAVILWPAFAPTNNWLPLSESWLRVRDGLIPLAN